jgi:sugar phosphate permease
MKIEGKNTVAEAGTRKGMLVTVCSIVYFISYLSRKNFAVVMAAMISGEIIDKLVGGFIGMGMFVFYGVGQLISGYLGDKIKPRSIMATGIALAVVTNVLMPTLAGVSQ